MGITLKTLEKLPVCMGITQYFSLIRGQYQLSRCLLGLFGYAHERNLQALFLGGCKRLIDQGCFKQSLIHDACYQAYIRTFGLWIVQKSYNRYVNRQHYKLDLSLSLR
jgi:hypothetical protein